MRFKPFVVARNSAATPFSLMEILFWSLEALQLPFVGAYLVHRGFSNESIGIIASVNALIAIIAPPFWGYVSDRMRSVRKVFLICLLSALCMIWLIPLSGIAPAARLSVPLIIPLFVLFVSFDNPLQSLLDSWMIQGIRTLPGVQYGNIRIWGSIGYGTVVALAGLLYKKIGVDWMFLCYTLLGLLAWLYALRFRSSSAPLTPKSHEKLQPLLLLKSGRYVLFVLYITLFFIPCSLFFTFMPQHYASVGGGQEYVGIGMMMTCLGEIVGFLLLHKLADRFSQLQRILIASLFFILRSLVLVLSHTAFHMTIGWFFQGTGNAIFLSGMAYFFSVLAPKGLKATSQTFGYAFSMGGATVMGSLLGGVLINSWGIPKVLRMELYYAIAIFALYLITLIPKRSRVIEEQMESDDTVSPV